MLEIPAYFLGTSAKSNHTSNLQNSSQYPQTTDLTTSIPFLNQIGTDQLRFSLTYPQKYLSNLSNINDSKLLAKIANNHQDHLAGKASYPCLCGFCRKLYKKIDHKPEADQDPLELSERDKELRALYIRHNIKGTTESDYYFFLTKMAGFKHIRITVPDTVVYANRKPILNFKSDRYTLVLESVREGFDNWDVMQFFRTVKMKQYEHYWKLDQLLKENEKKASMKSKM